MYDLWVSVLRTGVPYGVSFAAVQAARVGVDFDDSALSGWLVAAGGTVYYAAFRAAEARWPRAGWFLGIARPPAYLRPDSRR